MKHLFILMCIAFHLNCTEEIEIKSPEDGKNGTFGLIQGEDGGDGQDAPAE